MLAFVFERWHFKTKNIMALEFAKDDLEYIKETLEWLNKHTVLIEDNRTNCETEHSRTVNSLMAIERGLAQCSDENAALPLQSVTNRALLLKIKKLEADNKLLNFMVENGLGEEDMINDITYPCET